jgi:uncharacterized protein YqjF (DUF2071 family)
MTHVTPPAPITPVRPSPIARWWLRNRWDDLAFLHWSYEPHVVQALLPDGLRVDTFDGRAWVSLVPFQMRSATPRWCPPIPWISAFDETNVRTYVVDSAGNRAVWFFSLEASRLAIVVFARLLLGFPYVWSKMSVRSSGDERAYRTERRRWPSSPRSTTDVQLEIGGEILDPSPLDHFLTARWGTVAQWPNRHGRLRHHPVDHPAWTLRSATVVNLANTSFEAAGLPVPEGAPIVRWVETLSARFGRPTRV